jgi:hypothetical protein
VTLASTHFRLVFYAAMLALIRQAAEALGAISSLVDRFPFLDAYIKEFERDGLPDLAKPTAPTQWRAKVDAFEAAHADFLPFRALREHAALSYEDVVCLAGAGLVEDDFRIGAVCEALHGVAGESRPTAGLLASWFVPGEEVVTGLNRMRRLERLGLLVASNPSAPLAGWGLRLPSGLWPALRDDTRHMLPLGFEHRAASAAPAISDLVLPQGLAQEAAGLAALLKQGELDLLLLRGPAHNGRRQLAGAIAREAGKGVLELALTRMQNPDMARAICPLVCALGAVPLFTTEARPGERMVLPEAWWPSVPAAVVLGRDGGIEVPPGLRMATLELSLPDHTARRALWLKALPDAPESLRDRMASEARIASEIIPGIAQQAQVRARAAGRTDVGMEDIHLAARSYGREPLDALATRMPPLAPYPSLDGGMAAADAPARLIVDSDTALELDLLDRRCRMREQLGLAVGEAFSPGVSPGVRALFTGPSGTGKTLAARLLAWRLGKDLYICNLAAIVSKYIGETEKHMDDLFDCATATDVVLLIDEADALFAKRSESVRDSTDRYANMGTNFLLQRMDNYEGIVVLTTNLPAAMDPAFRRRMDASIDFQQPGPVDRQQILIAHLPAKHAISQTFLNDLVMRCVLSGGQIRNIVLHAALLAADTQIGEPDLQRAVEREYRKMGGVCPLPKLQGVK